MAPRLPLPPAFYDVADQTALRREIENSIARVESAATGATGAAAAPVDSLVVTHTADSRLTASRVATATSEVSFDLSVSGQIKAVIASTLARLGIAQTWTALQTFAAAILLDTGSNDSPARFKTSAAGVGPIVRYERTAATARVWQIRLGTNGKFQLFDETGAVLVAEIGSADMLLNGIFTALMAGGTPVVSNRNDNATANRGMYAGQRAGTTKWILGVDTSDRFIVMDAAGNAKFTIDTSTGTATAVGGLNAGSNVIINATGEAEYFVQRPAGSFGGFVVRTGANNRWGLFANNDAESGSDAGSNLVINRYSDAGVGTEAFRIARSSGVVTLGAQLNITGSQGLKFDTKDAGSFADATYIYVSDYATGLKGLRVKYSTGDVINKDGNNIAGVVVSTSAPSGSALHGTLWCKI